jgi:hypothetical protein
MNARFVFFLKHQGEILCHLWPKFQLRSQERNEGEAALWGSGNFLIGLRNVPIGFRKIHNRTRECPNWAQKVLLRFSKPLYVIKIIKGSFKCENEYEQRICRQKYILRTVWLYSIFPDYQIWCKIFGNKLSPKYVFWFSIQLLCEILLILRSIQWDIVTNVRRSSCNVPVILVRLQQNLNLPDRFSKNNQILNFIKIRPVGAELFHADGWTGRQPGTLAGRDEDNRRFSQFRDRA